MRVLSIVHQADAGPGVFAEAAAGHELEHWMPPEGPPPAELGRYDAALVFGGAMNVDEQPRFPWLGPEKALLRDLLRGGTPVLGVCLGAQLLAEAAGGQAQRAERPEIGWFKVDVSEAGAADPLIGPLAPGFEAFGWHSYEFFPPPGAAELAHSKVGVQAARFGPAAWGIQFHAEVNRESVEAWLDDYRSDPDAVRIRINPKLLLAQTERNLAGWNELGRDLCTRFLAEAEAATRA